MNKGGVKSVEEKSLYSSLEAVVKCKDCKKRKTDECLMYWNGIKDDETWDDDWFCADGVKRDDG